MQKRFENWKQLKPLTEHAHNGSQCVCLVDDFCFKAGDVVTAYVLDYDLDLYDCESEDAGSLTMLGRELALLPDNG